MQLVNKLKGYNSAKEQLRNPLQKFVIFPLEDPDALGGSWRPSQSMDHLGSGVWALQTSSHPVLPYEGLVQEDHRSHTSLVMDRHILCIIFIILQFQQIWLGKSCWISPKRVFSVFVTILLTELWYKYGPDSWMYTGSRRGTQFNEWVSVGFSVVTMNCPVKQLKGSRPSHWTARFLFWAMAFYQPPKNLCSVKQMLSDPSKWWLAFLWTSFGRP